MRLESFQACVQKKTIYQAASVFTTTLKQLQGTCKNKNSRHTGIIQPKFVSPSTYFVFMIINV